LRLAWRIALMMALTAGSALGQNRSSSGEIRPIAPAAATGPAVGPAHKEVDRRKPKAVATRAVRKSQPKLKAKPGAVPRLLTKGPAKTRLPAKSSIAAHPQSMISPTIHSTGIEQCWQRIQATLQPAKLLKLSDECERNFPASQFSGQIQDVAAAARRALEIQRVTGLSGDFFEDSVGDDAYRENLHKAVRGDRDAAYLIALAYRVGMSGVAASSRRMEQWLRFSAELGSGLASWELAQFYNYGGLVADAARFEKRAIELGYRPPFRLPTRGY